MRVPWAAKRSNQAIRKEISPEYSLVGLLLKLKLQSFGHLIGRSSSFKKTLMLGKIEGRRRRGQRAIWLDGITNSMGRSVSNSVKQRTERPGVQQSMVLQRVGDDWVTEQEQQICSVISESLRLHVLLPSCLLSIEFSRQKYQSGFPFPSPVDLPDPKIIPGSPTLQGRHLTVGATREACTKTAEKSAIMSSHS